VPGGVRAGLTREARDHICSRLPESFETAELALRRFKTIFDQFHKEVISFGDFPSLFMALVSEEGNWEHYDGHLRFVNSDGEIVANLVDPASYHEYIGEVVEPDSYLKSPYFKLLGPTLGIYRVGPLARLNVCTQN
jgi:NAD-reducing hydrogenase large subunit